MRNRLPRSLLTVIAWVVVANIATAMTYWNAARTSAEVPPEPTAVAERPLVPTPAVNVPEVTKPVVTKTEYVPPTKPEPTKPASTKPTEIERPVSTKPTTPIGPRIKVGDPEEDPVGVRPPPTPIDPPPVPENTRFGAFKANDQGDVMILVVETDSLRSKFARQLKEEFSQLKDDLKDRLIGIRIVGRERNHPWESLPKPTERFGRTNFQEAFNQAFDDADVIRGERDPNKVLTFLIWASDCQPDDVDAKLDLAVPKPTPRLVWLGDSKGGKDKRMNAVFKGKITSKESEASGLAGSIKHVLELETPTDAKGTRP